MWHLPMPATWPTACTAKGSNAVSTYASTPAVHLCTRLCTFVADLSVPPARLWVAWQAPRKAEALWSRLVVIDRVNGLCLQLLLQGCVHCFAVRSVLLHMANSFASTAEHSLDLHTH